MVRIGLTLYLALVTAAGPALCCCSLGRLYASLPAPTQAIPARPTCCCGQCEAPTADPVEEDEPAPDSPVPSAPHQPCPCKERGKDLSALSTPDRHAVESGESLSGLYPLEAGKLVPVSSAESRDLRNVPAETIAFPYFGPRGILRALHILRC
jgi:hypothetical protein